MASLTTFVSLLRERLEWGGPLSEDTIRYTYFHALTTTGWSHLQVFQEYPLPGYQGRMMDTVVTTSIGPAIATEFKFHREKIAGLPLPQLAGGIMSDLFRLAIAHAAWECDCYFVYLTDPTMATYLRKPRSGCADLIDASPGTALPIGVERLKGRTSTFLRALNGFANPGTVTCVLSDALPGDLHLWIFKVAHVPDAVYDWD